ncbi:MAG: hypothetical protein VYA30_11890 [Myxococcota bacterium]|nr:hypothetical protein [Myxococcota bacterium]
MDGRLRQVYLCLILSIGCGGETGHDEDGTPDLVDVKNVFINGCSFAACHGPELGAGGLVLKPEPLTTLVEAVSTAIPGKGLVVPGSLNDSYLFEKLTEERPAAGDPMPPSVPLDDTRLDLVRRWIEAGAPTE